MKIAIVHDELIRRGGAEQVTLLMHKAFPNAPIYTSCYNKDKTYSEFKKCDIRTSWLSYFVRSERMLKLLFFPFGIWAMKSLNLKEYDVVFISTTTSAKFVKTSKNNLFVAFCHYPFRLAWFPESYPQVKESKGFVKFLFKTVVGILQKVDYKSASNIDWFITNTPHIKELIKEKYQPKNKVSVISASIVCSNFHVLEKPLKEYYLVVSRLEPYKKVDLVIKAFNKMPNKKLIIVGKGSQKEKYIKMAQSNIVFKEALSKENIATLYANCIAFIFPQKEDYGLTPIEANASGRPVIAFGEGGITYTSIPFTGSEKKCTAVFFEKQTSQKIIDAIKFANTLDFDPIFIRTHALKFDEAVFIKKIKNFIFDKYANLK